MLALLGSDADSNISLYLLVCPKPTHGHLIISLHFILDFVSHSLMHIAQIHNSPCSTEFPETSMR